MSGGNNTGLRMAALLSAVAITIFVISAVLYLNTIDEPLNDFMPWIVGWCGPTIPALLGFALMGSKLDAADAKLEQVHREVNGNTSNLINQNAKLSTKVGNQVDELAALREQLTALTVRLDASEGRQPK